MASNASLQDSDSDGEYDEMVHTIMRAGMLEYLGLTPLLHIPGFDFDAPQNRPFIMSMAMQQFVARIMFANMAAEHRRANFKNTYDHILPPVTTPVRGDWSCAICDDNAKTSLVSHPSNCRHKFHYECLNKWCYESPRCPICNGSGAPLNMKRKN
jgi:hypothetical protein